MDEVMPIEFPNFFEKQKKGKGSRPYHKPNDATRKVVLAAIGMGMEQTKVSLLLDINPKTLRKFYRHELDTGVARANFSVAMSLYGRAISGKDTIAGIFWLKARDGWVDTVKHSHEGLPENITVTFALDAPKVEHEVIDVTPHKAIDLVKGSKSDP